jgi:hypothetical protein
MYVVLSCSDPRLNPYQNLGLDPTLSKSKYVKQDLDINIAEQATMFRNAGG